MTTSELVKKLCQQQGLSFSELARRIGQTRQNLYKKMKRETLTLEELKEIANAVGATFEQSFTLLDGTRLKINN